MAVVGFVMVAKVLIRLSDCRFDFVSKRCEVELGWSFPQDVCLGDDVDDDEQESCEIYQSNYNTRNKNTKSRRKMNLTSGNAVPFCVGYFGLISHSILAY